jgi:hypothetical protein
MPNSYRLSFWFIGGDCVRSRSPAAGVFEALPEVPTIAEALPGYTRQGPGPA